MFSNCVITNNSVKAYYITPWQEPEFIPVYAYGGGVYCHNSESRFDDCQFIRNSSFGVWAHEDPFGPYGICETGFGGGVSAVNSSVEFYNCSFYDNWTNQMGGAIDLANSTANIRRCVANSNYSIYYGGAIGCRNSSCHIVNCVFSSNATFDHGGAVCNSDSSSLIMLNSTIYGNKAECVLGGGGGIWVEGNSFTFILNCILWKNIPNQIALRQIPSIAVIYNDVEEGWTGIGNIAEDPLFIDEDNRDYRLQDSSPCINAGIDSIYFRGTWYCAPSIDIDGNTRPQPEGSYPDMGAYENPLGTFVELESGSAYPQNFQLYHNYPNPFNARTEIRYQIPGDGHVSLKILNALGQEVRTLVDGHKRAGEYELVWDGRNEQGHEVASGLYFCRLKAGDFGETIKMVLLR